LTLETNLTLKKSKKLLEASMVEADSQAVRDIVNALLKVNPDLIDAETFQRISRLVEPLQVALDTQIQIDILSLNIKDQQEKLGELTREIESLTRIGVDAAKLAEDSHSQVEALNFNVKNQNGKLEMLINKVASMEKAFIEVSNQLTMLSESERQLRQKQKFVLEALEQYLRRHS